MSKQKVIQEALDLLERNGARYVRNWATDDILDEHITSEDVKLLYSMLLHNQNFRSTFVSRCLPSQCKEPSSTARLARWGTGFIPGVQNKSDENTEQSVKEAAEKGKEIIKSSVVEEVRTGAIVGIKDAHGIIYDVVDHNELIDARIDKLMKTVEPYIYGGTPMINALQEAHRLLGRSEYRCKNKVLFVLSDGMPTDGSYPPTFTDLDVKVVSCYITNQLISEPRTLYSRKRHEWQQGGQFMFDLSSSIRTQLIPRSIFIKHGWNIEFENNETRLFFQINHPDFIGDVCSFVRDVVCSQDALCDVLASIDLDLYINKVNEGFEAKTQEGGTSYANASAAVMHLAMKRIVGRSGGYPDFFELRSELIAKYGKDGAVTRNVLREMCPKYRLHFKDVDTLGAMKAVTAKRPVIATFQITEKEWDPFSDFYKYNPKGILSKKDLGSPGGKLIGHAVVLTSFNSQCLCFMNSWGSQWADNGFFRIQNADVLNVKFMDIYWTLNDLYESEKQEYERSGPKIAEKLLTSLTGLRDAKYACPMCHTESAVSEFRGALVNAICPKCGETFSISEHDSHDLVLNMYLTSLSN